LTTPIQTIDQLMSLPLTLEGSGDFIFRRASGPELLRLEKRVLDQCAGVGIEMGMQEYASDRTRDEAGSIRNGIRALVFLAALCTEAPDGWVWDDDPERGLTSSIYDPNDITELGTPLINWIYSFRDARRQRITAPQSATAAE